MTPTRLRTWRVLLVLLVLVGGFALLALTAGNAAAAPAPSGGNSTSGPNATVTQTEQIDKNTVLLEARYDSQTGQAYVTLRSDTLQSVTVTDAGAFMEGGKVSQRSVMLKPGDTTTIAIPATKYDGFAGVSIATRNTLYAVPIEVEQQMFTGDPTWGTVRTAGAGAGAGVVLALVVEAWRRRSGGREEVSRLA